MSKGAVSQVIQRAIGDAAFRRQLQGDPNKALAGFDLTSDERSAITSGDPGRLTALGVDQRMSKAFNLSGISAASNSSVSPDLSGARASALVDEGGSAGRATSAIDTGGASGDFNAFDPGIVSNATSAARQPVDVSGDFNRLDPGIESNSSEATALEPGDANLDLGMIDPGYVSGGDDAARTTDVANDAGSHGLRPNEVTE